MGGGTTNCRPAITGRIQRQRLKLARPQFAVAGWEAPELFRELVPTLQRVAIFYNPNNPIARGWNAAAESRRGS